MYKDTRVKQGMSFQPPAIQKSYVKMPVNAWWYIPTSLPQELAAAKTNNIVSVVRIQVFSIMHRWGGLHMTDHAPLEMAYI